jgi:enoyl-CoA hydratase/carnithine racemase
MAEVEVERRGSVEILRINRPEVRNAMNPDVMAAIGFGIARADDDPAVGAVVVTGTGDRAFCAGMDLRGFVDGSSEEARARVQEGVAAYRRHAREGAKKPVVAAANGAAVAGGFELLLSCDMVVAAEHARFGLPEVQRALFPLGGGVFLSRRIPAAVALELVLTGDTIDAARAFDLGLVNEVVPGPDVLDRAVALAERVTRNGPLAVQAAKRLVRAAAVEPADAVWALQEEMRPAVFDSSDAREGAAAFIEKRDPVWRGS